jgi:hypothetical protein
MTRQDNLLSTFRPNLFAKLAGLTVMLVGCAALECHDTPVIVWTNKDLSAEERERLQRSAQSIALKGQDGIDVVINELQRFVASGAAVSPLIERTL